MSTAAPSMMTGPRPLRVCLVTSAHVSNNPRIVKEADALDAAGHAVRVVALEQDPDLARRDLALVRTRGWDLVRVAAGGGSMLGRLRRLRDAVLERLALRAMARGARHYAICERVASRHVGVLARAVAQVPADLVIAHNIAALPAAGRAAGRMGAALGFDVEDLHTSEISAGPQRQLRKAAIERVEARWLARCRFLTASSDGIADEIVRLYGVKRPRVVLNVFPRAELYHATSEPDERPEGIVSLYWFSQVIGRGRGLEDAIAALRLLPRHVHLFLRGALDPTFGPVVAAAGEESVLAGRIHLLPLAAPDELVPLAARHDIGLALEPPVSLNKQLATSNKLLTYLLAGLAVAATDTPGQRGVVETAAGAGFVYAPGDVPALARGIASLIERPGRLAEAKRRARAAADSRFCWDVEREVLLRYLTGAVDTQALEPEVTR